MLAETTSVLSPLVILVLCVVAGVGTVLLLPSRREASLRKVGGAVLLASGLILAALMLRLTAGSPQGGMGPYFWIFSAIAIFGAIRVVTHPQPVYSALYFVLTVFASAGLFLLLWAEFMAAALVLIYAGAILVTYVFVIMLASEAAQPGTGARNLTEHDRMSRDPAIAAAVGFALMGVMLFVIFDKANGLRPGAPFVSSGTESTSESAAITTTQLQLAHTNSGGPAPVSEPQAQTWDFYSGSDTPNWNESKTITTPIVSGSTQELGVFLFQKHLVNVELAGLILTVSMVGAIVIARRKVVGDIVPGSGEMLVAPATPVDDNPHSIPVVGTRNPRQKEFPET